MAAIKSECNDMSVVVSGETEAGSTSGHDMSMHDTKRRVDIGETGIDGSSVT